MVRFIKSMADDLPDGMAEEMLDILDSGGSLQDLKDELNDVCTSWGYPDII